MEKELIEIITSGIILGTIAGISPGPLLTLVISESFKNGKMAGIRMAFVPLISDFPIILISLYILSRLSDYKLVLGIISIAGSLFLLYLVYENLFYRQINMNLSTGKSRSILKGVLANFLSPHPYLFWILIGGSLILKAAETNPVLAILFVLIFYSCLIGSKVAVAFLTFRFSSILQTRWYIYTIRSLGFVLLIFAIYFFIEGVNYIL